MTNLPSTRECIILYIIRENYGISGYRVRKIFIQSVGKELSFGTLVPMLQRFEKQGLIGREEIADGHLWHITSVGILEVDRMLDMLEKMLPKKNEEIASVGIVGE